MRQQPINHDVRSALSSQAFERVLGSTVLQDRPANNPHHSKARLKESLQRFRSKEPLEIPFRLKEYVALDFLTSSIPEIPVTDRIDSTKQDSTRVQHPGDLLDDETGRAYIEIVERKARADGIELLGTERQTLTDVGGHNPDDLLRCRNAAESVTVNVKANNRVSERNQIDSVVANPTSQVQYERAFREIALVSVDPRCILPWCRVRGCVPGHDRSRTRSDFYMPCWLL
jgi:hypothetical protein